MTESATHVATPQDDWPRLADRLRPGEHLALAPGDYIGGVALRRGGTADAPIVLRALDPGTPPRLASPDGRPIIDVHADDVTLRGLAFPPTPPAVHAVVVRDVSRVTVEACRFDGIGGLAIVQTMNGRGLTVRGNHVRGSRATAMYFGCHEGGCEVLDLLIEGNDIEGVTAPRGDVGYGIQVKLRSTAVIRGNVVRDTKGPGIMVYGTGDPTGVSLVEGNIVSGSRRSSGIVVGGGPAIVRGNTACDNREAGIALEDYGARGLLLGLEVRDNTVYGNRRGGIMAPSRGMLDARITGNHVHAVRRTRGLPRERPGLILLGNADCSGDRCHR